MVKVSVIIPVYNGEKNLENTVKSILTQSLQDLELILVDDGSNDTCARLCDSIADSDQRVKVLHKNNGGISSARNVGIDNAAGEFLAFVDQDDEVEATMYEELLKKAEDKDYDIVISDFNLIYPDHIITYKTFDIHDNYSDTYKDMLMHGYGGNVWNMIMRKSLVNSINLRFPEHLRHGEDWYFTFRLFLNTEKVAKVDKSFYQYNLGNPSQVSNNLDERFLFCCMENIDEVIEYMKNKGVFHTYRDQIYQLVLQTKTNFVYDPKYYSYINTWRPESNKDIVNSKIISFKMKILLTLIRLRLYPIAYGLIRMYRAIPHQ